ncbi:PREDICTED: uncharacterized protein LOC105566887 [Vollenhovia emeryi]|uniref:uncharacterized protein LOC105566887 n=1 Tax=Vollenhovia emeryi TaxID=411798 RepID=UPI0005F41888|nr:PREDICTED: uncharacterized protein LOC105566887 [Vollenhovia emeryi]
MLCCSVIFSLGLQLICLLIFQITPKSVENIDSNSQLLQTIQQEDLSITNSSIKRRRTDIEAQSSSPKQYYDVDNNVTNILEDFIPTSPSESLSTSAASTEFNVTVLPNKCNVTISAETEQHATTDNEYNLESILNKSEDGQLVLSVYKSQGKLNNDLRNKLAKLKRLSVGLICEPDLARRAGVRGRVRARQ